MNSATVEMPGKRKTRQEKWKERRGEKAKRNSQDGCFTVKLIETFLPAYAQTNEKAVKCRTCKGLCGMFYLFMARQTKIFYWLQ